jgi:uncharacterized protein (TIRG00374 family)
MKIPWRGAIGLALSVLLLWWAFHGVKWTEVWRDVRTADPVLVFLAVLVGNMIFPLRAIRWRPILDPVAPSLPYGKLWRATAIGMMANNILPARAGELVRAFVLSRETTVPFSAAFASLVVDRVFDAVIVLLLVVAAMMDPRFPAGVSALAYAGTGVLLFLAVGVALYAIVFFPDRLIRLYEVFARRLVPRFEERGRIMLRSFANGLSVLRHPKRFVIVFFWALLLWLTQGFAFWIMFRAIGITAPFSAALLVQGLIVLWVAMPSTPGFFGPFEFASVTALGWYGVHGSLAAAWALSYHVLSLIPITFIGLVYVVRSGLQLGELKQLKR